MLAQSAARHREASADEAAAPEGASEAAPTEGN